MNGAGVLSGELYVYEPDSRNGYRHKDPQHGDCHASCIKMLQFYSEERLQGLNLTGLTVVEPPYHSFVVYGNEDTFVMDVRRYKQVGSWYWQTDGLEIYSGSTQRHCFLHTNDDAIKLYHSNILVEDIVIWKGENGPAIQFGWYSRDMSQIVARDIAVIHNLMHYDTHNICIINSAKPWDGSCFSDRTVRDVSFERIRAEGANFCAMRTWAVLSLARL